MVPSKPARKTRKILRYIDISIAAHNVWIKAKAFRQYLLLLWVSNPNGSLSKSFNSDILLIATRVGHSPIGLFKDLLEHFIMPILVVECLRKFYIHMLRYHLNTDVKQCANNADTKGCPDYCSLREAWFITRKDDDANPIWQEPFIMKNVEEVHTIYVHVQYIIIIILQSTEWKLVRFPTFSL